MEQLEERRAQQLTRDEAEAELVGGRMRALESDKLELQTAAAELTRLLREREEVSAAESRTGRLMPCAQKWWLTPGGVAGGCRAACQDEEPGGGSGRPGKPGGLHQRGAGPAGPGRAC